MPRATKAKKIRNLVLVLGDQLSLNVSSLAAADPAQDLVIMCEVAE
jgi:deoxyribodipyrimidine photolyase-related protein